MKYKSIRQVGLLIETSLSSGRDMLIGIEQYLHEHEPWHVYARPSRLGQLPPSWFQDWQGDGIIARIQDKAIADRVLAKGVPCVDVLGVFRSTEMPLVHVDNRAIAEMAADHLIEQGLIRFAYFGIRNEYWAEERAACFHAHVLQHGFDCSTLTIPRNILERTAWDALLGRVATWLRVQPPPFGIMMCSDVQALLVSEACRAVGLSVGEDVAVIGVGNDQPLCNMSHPLLSSVDANHLDVGYRAAELLARMMDGESPPDDPILVQPRGIVARASTDILAIDDPAMIKALRLIREHFAEPLHLDDVARQAGLSRSVLQRRFRAVLHRTVHEEITRNRLQRAIWLLHETNHSVETIAEESGFGCAQNLGRVFRRKFQMPPTRYRASPGPGIPHTLDPEAGSDTL